MESEQSEYAKEQQQKHRRRIILPVVIPWEYGSNKFASQKGSRGFGGARDPKLKIFSTTPFPKNDESVIPKLAAPGNDQAGQAGTSSFGKHRDQVTLVSNTNTSEKIDVNQLVPDKDKTSERILKKWSQPNPEAKNNDLFGRRRNAVTTATGGRRFTPAEQAASRASIPRFQDARLSSAAINARPGESLSVGLNRSRQATTEIEGLCRGEKEQLETNRYLAWIGGQLTLQSQAHTGGFQKTRDVVSNSYYEKLMSEREVDPRALRPKRGQMKKTVESKEKEDQQEE